ncbi:hypothetical protein, partial [Paraburkholderia sp. SIMBA_054]|uniref:hypothetical protein n=1 Tax=Paraburkholderia sp. SIMBA_054 TaxID=3085795 RepID=UPI0039794BD4
AWLLAWALAGLASGPVLAVEPAPAGTGALKIDVRPFPRQFTVEGTQFSIHEPQYDSWKDDQLAGRFVMAVKSGTHAGPDGKPQDV